MLAVAVPKWDTRPALTQKATIMAQDETETMDLPAVIQSIQSEVPSFSRVEMDTSFVSQLIAERDRLPPQRLRRRATLGVALDAYRQSERSDAPRLPQGFFRTAEA